MTWQLRGARKGGVAFWLLVVLGLGFVALGVVLARHELLDRKLVITPSPASKPTTSAAATAPTSAPALAKARPREYMDVIRLNYPDFPTTQPLDVPLNMSEAARLIINDPLYLDAQGELWITRDDAESTVNVLRTVDEHSTHVLKERVVYVHRCPDETGQWQTLLFCRKPDGGYEMVTRQSRTDIDSNYNYDWNRATSWVSGAYNIVIVPTDRGVSLIRPDRRPMEVYHEFIPADEFVPGRYSKPQALIDWRGLIAWMPWENDKIGSKGAARFVRNEQTNEEGWVTLDASCGWPEKFLHLVPLFDGSVLQLVVKDDKAVEVKLNSLDAAPIDEKKIAELVDQLSDPDSTKRVMAFNELTRWGPGLWPVLENLRNDQPPEAQVRISQLLESRITPNLGGLLLQSGPVTVLTRSTFGSAMLFSQAGVRLQVEGGDDPPLVAPAWISLVPGRAIELAPAGLIDELKVKGREISMIRGEWIVTDDADGPRWWMSNHLSGPLLKEKDIEFRNLIGQDGRGRWLFRKNVDDEVPTLVIDPTLPDPTPRMPVWVYTVEEGTTGWTEENWPAIKRGGAWALIHNDWKPLDEKTEKFITPESAAQTSLAEAPTTAPSTLPTTSPATTQASAEPPILAEADGTKFYNGHETLRMIKPDGREVTWALPPSAVGKGEVRLLRAGENRLFLLNTPGRLLRLRETPQEPEPFKLEATFTKHIPNADHLGRMWVDGDGRIIISYDTKSLAICFPSGRIPPEIASKMTAKDLQDAED